MRLTKFFIALLLAFHAPKLFSQRLLTFDDSARDQIRIQNSSYSLVLSKENGHIVDLYDLVRNKSLTLGSQGACLWTVSVALGAENHFDGGCGFSPQGTNLFRYAWQEATATLQLAYMSASPSTPTAIVLLTFGEGSYFDIRLSLKNQTAGTVQTVGVPGGLLFSNTAISSAYLPILLPGVRLKPEFFRSNRTAAQTYPGQLCFADLFAVDFGGSILSIQTINPDGPIQPVLLGLFDNTSDMVGTILGAHRFETDVRPGADYTSPTVRIQIDATIEEAIQSYRTNNKISSYPSVQEKLGAEFESISRSPLVRADFGVFGRDLAGWTTDLGRIRPPALIHPVGFQMGGHDNNYPDFLPPNPIYGSTSDFRSFANAAAARGLTVMPHTNYTWWNGASPTLRVLSPNQIPPLMVQTRDGRPVLETYGNGEQSNTGYVVSPSVVGVRSRVDAAWTEWKNDAGINHLFLDQIGSRSEVRDYNPAAASSLEYYDRWLELTRNATGMSFTTEGGWDKLAKTFWGFFGSAMSGQQTRSSPLEMRWGVGSPANNIFGPDTWEPYPIATWLFHDKVLFYQHNLEFSTYTANFEVLSWNVLFGLMQIHLWPGTPGQPPDPQWVDLAQAMQRTVSARQAGKPLAQFTKILPDVAESRFGDLVTTANWNTTDTYSTDGSTIAPSGFISRTDDNSLIAGVFQGGFANEPLSAGSHFIVLERDSSLVTLRHPIGPDTDFVIETPANMAISGLLVTAAVDQDNNFIDFIPRTFEGGKIRFSSAAVNGRRPSRFAVQTAGQIAMTDGAEFKMGPVSPGEIVSLFGTGIGPAQSQGVKVNSGLIATDLGGRRLLFNGVPAPILYVSKDQINAIVPYSTATLDSVVVQLEKDGKTDLSITVPIVNAMPRLFTSNGTGTGSAAAVNQDGSLNRDRAASAGSVITLYGSGGGLEKIAAADGELARDASRTLQLPTTVRIDNRAAQVLYAGAAPGFAGMFQINVRIPLLSARGNAIPVEIRVADAPTQAAVTIAVQ